MPQSFENEKEIFSACWTFNFSRDEEKRERKSFSQFSFFSPHFLTFHETFPEIRHRRMTMIIQWLQWKLNDLCSLRAALFPFQFSIHSCFAASGLVEIEFVHHVYRIVVSYFSCWRFSCLKNWLKKKRKFHVQCQNYVKRIRPWCFSASVYIAKWNMNGRNKSIIKSFITWSACGNFCPHWKFIENVQCKQRLRSGDALLPRRMQF